MVWIHLPQRSNLFAVFDEIRRVGTGMAISEVRVLKLVQSGELLDQVEFPDLQAQVRIDEERTLSQNVPDNFLRVLVIVKRPLLALRYMLPDGQIRRMQMNFSPPSGCDVALENLKGAGLPIRDRDLPQVKSQHHELSQSQQHSQERPGSLNAHQVASRQSSQSLFPGPSHPWAQKGTGAQNAYHGSAHLPVQPAPVNIRPISAPGGLKQHRFSRPISTSYGSTLNASGSTITVTSVPVVPEPRIQTGLLPSPVFNAKYAPFGGLHIRPMSAPERAQIPRDHTSKPSLSHLLPSERSFPFPEKDPHELESQTGATHKEPGIAKPKPRRQTKPRAQPAKPRKSRAKVEATGVSSGQDPLALSPPSSMPQAQNIVPSSEPPALPTTSSRKHSLIDDSVNQPNKRPAQATTVETGTQTTRTETTAAAIVAEKQPAPVRLPKVDELSLDSSQRELLGRIDRLMKKRHDDSIDNLMQEYHGLPAAPNNNRPHQSSSSQEHHCTKDAAAQSDDDDVGDNGKALEDLIRECSKNENFWKMMDGLEEAWKGFGLSLEKEGRTE